MLIIDNMLRYCSGKYCTIICVLFTCKAKPEDTLDLSRIVNNDLADTVRKYPKRFVGLGTLPMQAPELGKLHFYSYNINLKRISLQDQFNTDYKN